MSVCLSVKLTLYYSLPWNSVSEINEEKNLLLSPLAETWCKFWVDGVGALAPKIFFTRPPKMRNLGGRRGTHCYLELNVGSVLSCIDAVYITVFYPLTRDLCLFLVGLAKSKSTT